MRLKQNTVRAALNRDESSGFAVARFVLERGDVSWNPDDPHEPIAGPCSLTYERFHGRTVVLVSDPVSV